ncbi:glutamine amidotransferase [Puniceibacterium sediminis]|uniref:GMP synthase (Glutamine-hydrolysing) n=1 Tax=Puniceibacterium sediminis TaxID=1608407 RepID=A0A238XBE9_9RHOB|nr:glutamine amidotransferase [Puniceibacterium sediminis]SNR56020.1 GMP synthase (glutamine-hydrolysing) [Puniceibacterium sediminis]
MRPFLILQLRPEADASDAEFAAFLDKGNLRAEQTHRIRLESESLPADINLHSYSGVIVGGGPGCVSDAPNLKDPTEAHAEAQILSLMPQITAQDIPFLGCCYGIGILAHHLGAEVSKARYGEKVGAVTCHMTPDGHIDPLLNGLPDSFDAFVGHKEAVQDLPPGCVHLLQSDPCPFQMIRYGSNVYATQFHPEADADVFAERVLIYRNRGYFQPETAEEVIEMCHTSDVTIPERILQNFVARYG